MTTYKYSWNSICWKQVENLVFQWQHKIYQASISGNKNRIYFFQNKLSRSTIGKVIAIRRSIRTFETQYIKIQDKRFPSYSFNFKIFIKKVTRKKKSKNSNGCIFPRS